MKKRRTQSDFKKSRKQRILEFCEEVCFRCISPALSREVFKGTPSPNKDGMLTRRPLAHDFGLTNNYCLNKFLYLKYIIIVGKGRNVKGKGNHMIQWADNNLVPDMKMVDELIKIEHMKEKDLSSFVDKLIVQPVKEIKKKTFYPKVEIPESELNPRLATVEKVHKFMTAAYRNAHDKEVPQKSLFCDLQFNENGKPYTVNLLDAIKIDTGFNTNLLERKEYLSCSGKRGNKMCRYIKDAPTYEQAKSIAMELCITKRAYQNRKKSKKHLETANLPVIPAMETIPETLPVPEINLNTMTPKLLYKEEMAFRKKVLQNQETALEYQKKILATREKGLAVQEEILSRQISIDRKLDEMNKKLNGVTDFKNNLKVLKSDYKFLYIEGDAEENKSDGK